MSRARWRTGGGEDEHRPTAIARQAAGRPVSSGGLLVFDDTGITGHPDHRAATQAAVRAAGPLSLPELAWALPAGIAGRLRAETGQPFAGQAPGRLDFAIRVSRTRQRQAALLHASQVSPEAPLWRRLELQGDTGHLRWLAPRRPERSRHCVRGEHRVRRGTGRASRAGHGQCRQCRRR